MAADACNPIGVSYAWIDPHGKVHRTTQGHEEWALRFVQGFPDLKREADQEGDAGSVLLFRGWIRFANFTAIQAWDGRTPTDAAWRAVVDLVRDCAVRTRALDPFEPIVYVEYMDISSRADVYSVAEFIERFGGKRESEAFFESMMSRTAATVTVDVAHLDRLRKEVLGIARAADAVDSVADVELVRSGVNRWRARWDTFAFTLRQDLDQRIREADRPYDPKYNPNPPDKSDAEQYLKESLKPMWEFDAELNRYPRTDTALKDVYGNPWRPPEEAFEDTVRFYLDRGYAATRDDAVREAQRYHEHRPLQTRAEAEATTVERWRTEAVKWTRRLRDKARKAWATLERYIAWLDSWRGGARPLTVVHPEEENVPIAGFRVVFRGFDESSYKNKLGAVKAGLERYRAAAAARAPILLKLTPPIFIEWTFEPTSSSDAAAYYTHNRVNITPWTIGDDIDRFVWTMAHEVGHHLFKVYLSGDAKTAWAQFIRGGYGDLDLREALAVMDRVGATSVIDRSLQEADPILHLQLSTLMNSPTYKYGVDWLFADNIRKYLDGGGDPVVRVPMHPITGYAGKSDEEAFCETLGLLVAYGTKALLSPVRVMLRSILGDGVRLASTGPARVASAWLARTAARRPKYQGKKEVPKADGSGTTTVYQYGPRQVANRHKEKAERVEGLRGRIGDLRRRVKSDLKADDLETRLTALAVALIDATYERVGNDESADNGHYGVTGWTMDHVTFSKDGKRATFRYVGKSGVDHEKTVDDADLVKALKSCCGDKGKNDHVLSDGDVRVKPAMVNDYLREFDVTAKDLRGFHANREMQERLRSIRRDGPELPRPRKDRDAILKEEFAEALEGAAEAVGHEPSTLRKQYLVPWLEESYMKDGTVIDRLDKRASGLAGWTFTATKTHAEREDDEAERLVRRSPKLKPSRDDSKRERMEVDDPDTADRDRDLSLNYKDNG